MTLLKIFVLVIFSFSAFAVPQSHVSFTDARFNQIIESCRQKAERDNDLFTTYNGLFLSCVRNKTIRINNIAIEKFRMSTEYLEGQSVRQVNATLRLIESLEHVNDSIERICNLGVADMSFVFQVFTDLKNALETLESANGTLERTSSAANHIRG